jgi:hypothetical protein
MTRTLAAFIVLAGLALALPACSSVSSWFDSSSKAPAVDPNLFPADYKKEIIDTMRTLVDEPPKVRDSFVTDPVLRTAGSDQRYVVCVRASARSAVGRFEAPKDRIAYFYGGHLNQLVDATPEQCGNAAYKPFPELDRMCGGKSCERGG